MKSSSPARSRIRSTQEKNTSYSRIMVLVVAFAFIWLLAVVKVFLLEKSRAHSEEAGNFVSEFASHSNADDDTRENIASGIEMGTLKFRSKRDSMRNYDRGGTPISEGLPRIGDWNIIRAPVGDGKKPKDRKPRPALLQRQAPDLPSVPDNNEIKSFVKIDSPGPISSPNVNSNSVSKSSADKQADAPGQVQHTGPNEWIPAYDLKFPPVQRDGSIKANEGFETMAMTGLKVPRFWEPPPGVDTVEHREKIKGHDTIFLMIASYRDFQCRETIASAYERADHPESLFVGAVDQVVDGDVGCLDLAVPCSKDPSQKICIYMDQISIFKYDASLATGPVTARHVGYRMYRGQAFFMQMDAHCMFVNHWDTGIIKQWASTMNEMAVLSSYLTDVQGSITKSGESTRNTRPIMCNSDFEGLMPARYIRHNSQPEEVPAIKDMPQMQPYWAAGFSFARGHFVVTVPYDAYQSMVFQGEEISIGVRGFTHGYDFYAPRTSVVFHEYAERSSRRKKIPMFWENSAAHKGQGVKALKRSMSIIKMAPDIPADQWDHSEEKRYGIGTVRTPELFYKLFLIDTTHRKATQLCPFVKSGKMHNHFQPYVQTKEKKGVDYSKLEHFDTLGVIENHFAAQRPFGEDMIRNALKSKNRREMDEAVKNALRIGIDRTNPELFQKGKAFLDNN